MILYIESGLVGGLILISIIWACCCSPGCVKYGLTSIFSVLFLGIGQKLELKFGLKNEIFSN